MEKISKGFVGRIFRAVLFIVLVILFCTAISSAGIYLASRYGLTQSREQAALTTLSIGSEEEVELPGRGKMVEGDGWKLRNTRDVYTLYLDHAVIEGEAGAKGEQEPCPAITVSGDLVIELKEGSDNWIRSEGTGICIQAGTLVIRGKGSLTVEAGEGGIAWGDPKERISSGSAGAAVRVEGGRLDIRGGDAGIRCPVVELAGGSGYIEADRENGIGIIASSFKVEEVEEEIKVKGNSAALAVAAPVSTDASRSVKPYLEVSQKVAVSPEHIHITELQSIYPYGDGKDIRKDICNILTYSSGEMAAYDDSTSAFEGAAGEITFSIAHRRKIQ